MTSYDRLLADLAERIDALPRPSIADLFVACAAALMPGFRQWATQRGEETEPLLARALATSRSFALTGEAIEDVQTLLASMEAAPPADEVSSTLAQDCWICADISVRVIADPQFAAGPGIEYALEPIVQRATAKLHGVSQLGSGPEEDSQMEAVLRRSDVTAALSFCSWAVDFLGDRPKLTKDDFAELTGRAIVLMP